MRQHDPEADTGRKKLILVLVSAWHGLDSLENISFWRMEREGLSIPPPPWSRWDGGKNDARIFSAAALVHNSVM